MSRAHADLRFFGAHASYQLVDQALVQALRNADALESPDLAAYAARAPSALCAVKAGASRELGPASVRMKKNVAFIVPGTGVVTVPAHADAVVLDLRAIPEGPRVAEQLEVAVGAAIATPLRRLPIAVREHFGMTDEVFDKQNVYKMKVTVVPRGFIPAHAARDFPIAVATGATMAPAAAALVADLRVQRRAIIIGHDVVVATAEARWFGIGSSGVYVRDGDLISDGERLPDVLPADLRWADPGCGINWARDIASTSPSTSSPGPSRSRVEVLAPFGDRPPVTEGRGVARAALVVAHGAVGLFFPFPERVQEADSRWSAALAATADPGVGRTHVADLLRSYGAALNDGHNLVHDASQARSKLKVEFESISRRGGGGVPDLVVRRSAIPDLAAGDSIVSVADVPIERWLEGVLSRTSAATPGHRLKIAALSLAPVKEPRDLVVRNARGAIRQVHLTAGPREALPMKPAFRPSGFLDHKRGRDIYYVNLDSSALPSWAPFEEHFERARSARAIVLDLRGYPGRHYRRMVSRFLLGPTSSPRFEVPRWVGPMAPGVEPSSYAIVPEEPTFRGPVALLLGNGTVSRAEDMALMLVDARRVITVGRHTAGTDGNITGLQLPGGYQLTFTGMRVRRIRGDDFVGILPDVQVELTAEALSAGLDQELEAAVAALNAAK